MNFQNWIQDWKHEFFLEVGLDLSPHYKTSLEPYRRNNPGTQIGQPGRWDHKNHSCFVSVGQFWTAIRVVGIIVVDVFFIGIIGVALIVETNRVLVLS